MLTIVDPLGDRTFHPGPYLAGKLERAYAKYKEASGQRRNEEWHLEYTQSLKDALRATVGQDDGRVSGLTTNPSKRKRLNTLRSRLLLDLNPSRGSRSEAGNAAETMEHVNENIAQ